LTTDIEHPERKRGVPRRLRAPLSLSPRGASRGVPRWDAVLSKARDARLVLGRTKQETFLNPPRNCLTKLLNDVRFKQNTKKGGFYFGRDHCS